MTIAVHTCIHADTDPSRDFNYGCFSLLASRYPEHHFIFISDKPFPEEQVQQKNINSVLLGPSIKNRLLQYYWYNFKLPRVLNRYNTDHFICSGLECSLRSQVPQYIILHDLSFLGKHKRPAASEAAYQKRNFRKFIKQAASVIITNESLREKILEQIPGISDKIKYINNPVVTATIDDAAITKLKEQHTGGNEYFLAFITGAGKKNIMILLKAFSLFKKRQLSNMQLVLLLTGDEEKNLVPDFNNYKYREQVKMISRESAAERPLFIAGAYAAVYLPDLELYEPEVFQSMSYHVPMIASDNAFCRSAFGEVALYCNNDVQQVADQLMLLYKDENRRNILKQHQQRLAAERSALDTAEKLWQVLTTADETA